MCKCYHWSRFSTESSPAAPALFFFALSTSLFSSLQPPHFFFLPETLMLALPSSKTQQFRHEIPRAFDPVLADFLQNSRRFPVPFSFPARRRRAAGGGRRAVTAGRHRKRERGSHVFCSRQTNRDHPIREERGRFGDSLSNADVDATAFPGPTPTAHRAFQLWQGPAMCTCLAQLGTGFATKRE